MKTGKTGPCAQAVPRLAKGGGPVSRCATPQGSRTMVGSCEGSREDVGAGLEGSMSLPGQPQNELTVEKKLGTRVRNNSWGLVCGGVKNGWEGQELPSVLGRLRPQDSGSCLTQAFEGRPPQTPAGLLQGRG